MNLNTARDTPIFFENAVLFRAWLQKHHAARSEQWVGFYRKDSRRPSITWPESVDEALCFGWIDGLRKKVDDESYKIRFTPRRAKSVWSAVNIRRMTELLGQRRVRAAGRAAYARRLASKSGIYAYENRRFAVLSVAERRQFRANPAAWKWFRGQPASYRQTAIWWVVCAKRRDTQRTRLAALIADSARKRKIGPVRAVNIVRPLCSGGL